MAHLNEITKAKEVLKKEMACFTEAKPEVYEAIETAIEVMEDKIEELVNYGW
ncbi:hypothetical protein [Murimonas intestini]|uniref:Uncharacterized protein n=1 Tax=Murimonas intestini TaxID=1337051 RepID=A0AB73SZS6_9FIRM|nr:hypothetical protein [Murimonas intestini]MCR1842779.1 hypothetical protein [Murimonas intestini]MCR1867882.1 hypothetical protein [Murimonas intestini]MCR1885234.1 hypothetical protein [Murimonas intestini]